MGELVAALSAPSRAERAAAERRLSALPPAAADLLPVPGSPAFPARPAAVAALDRVRAALAAGRGGEEVHEPPRFAVDLGPAVVRPRFGAGGTLLRIPVTVRADPEARPLLVRAAGDALRVTAPDGTVLAPFSPGASREVGFVNGTATFAADFSAPDEPPAFVTAAGSFAVESAPPPRRFRFPLTAEPRSESSGGVTVRLAPPAIDGGRVTVTAVVLYAAAGDSPAFDSYRTWRLGAAVRLTGFGGTREPADPARVVADAPAAVAVRATFELPDGADAGEYTVEVVAPAAPVTGRAGVAGVRLEVGSR